MNRGRTGYMRRVYALVARRYDWLMDRVYGGRDAAWRDAALDAVRDDDRVLEVGAGTCRTEARADHDAGYVSLDVSRRMLAASDADNPVEGDVHALPFRDGAFDVVVAVLLLSTRINHDRAVAEMARVADRRVVVVDKFSRDRRHQRWLDRAKTALAAPLAFDFDVDVEALAAANGLDVRDRQPTPRNLGMIERVILE